MGKAIKTVYPAFRTDKLLFDVNLYEIKDNCVVAEHGHSYVELLLCLRGACEHLINGKSGTAEAGDLIVMHPGWTHELRAPLLFEHMTIAFTETAPETVAPELTGYEGFKRLFRPARDETARIRLSGGGYKEVKELANSMLREYKEKRPGWQTFMRAYFSSLVALLSRLKMEKPEDAGLSRLNGVLSYIETNFRSRIKMDRLAKMSGLSESQLHRLFKKAYGTSPIDYLIKVRIEEAKRLLLLEGDRVSIAELASATGFADGNYLCRAFKKTIGVPPRRYARSLSCPPSEADGDL